MQLDPDGAEHLPALLDPGALESLAARFAGTSTRRVAPTPGLAYGADALPGGLEWLGVEP